MDKRDILIEEFLTIILKFYSEVNNTSYDYSHRTGTGEIIIEDGTDLSRNLANQELISFLREHLELYGCRVEDDAIIRKLGG